jgi:hypothetical protein
VSNGLDFILLVELGARQIAEGAVSQSPRSLPEPLEPGWTAKAARLCPLTCV